MDLLGRVILGVDGGEDAEDEVNVVLLLDWASAILPGTVTDNLSVELVVQVARAGAVGELAIAGLAVTLDRSNNALGL